jgi:hypothetical protein
MQALAQARPSAVFTVTRQAARRSVLVVAQAVKPQAAAK